MTKSAAKSGTRGRSYNGTIAFVQKQVARLHAAVYRATGGGIGGRMVNSPVLLLITTGRRTGRERTTPLLYLKDGDAFAIVASNGGTSRHPAWWLNLKANQEAKVDLRSQRLPARAEDTTGEMKRRLWGRVVEMYPAYEDYQRRTDREIPVILLKPTP